MEALTGLAEIIRIWLDGGTWADIQKAHGSQALVGLAVWLVPSSIILVGISGWSDWRETPLAAWLGFAPRDPNENWAEEARDIDKDGMPDF
jgi:hypothetical protein